MALVSAAALIITALLCVSLIGVAGGFASTRSTGHQVNPAAGVLSSELPVPGLSWHSAHPMGKAPLG